MLSTLEMLYKNRVRQKELLETTTAQIEAIHEDCEHEWGEEIFIDFISFGAARYIKQCSKCWKIHRFIKNGVGAHVRS